MSDVRALPSQQEVRVACKVLGVSPGASRTSVLSAWKAALRDTHPDVADPAARALAEERAKGVNAAKSTLLAALGPDGTLVLPPPPPPARSTQPAPAGSSSTSSGQPSLHAVRLPPTRGHAGTKGAKKAASERRRHLLVVLGAAAATIAVIAALAYIVLRDSEEPSGTNEKVGTESVRSADPDRDDTTTVGDVEQLLPTPAVTVPDPSGTQETPGGTDGDDPVVRGGEGRGNEPGPPPPTTTPTETPATTPPQYVAKTPERAAEIVVLAAVMDYRLISIVVDRESDPDEWREIVAAINKAGGADVSGVTCKTTGSTSLCRFTDAPESLERGLAMHRDGSGSWMLTGWGRPLSESGSGE